jgi:hypothetical protein
LTGPLSFRTRVTPETRGPYAEKSGTKHVTPGSLRAGVLYACVYGGCVYGGFTSFAKNAAASARMMETRMPVCERNICSAERFATG